MIEIKGKYNSAKIFATTVENEVKLQVLEMLNLKAFENYKIRIQADTHSGKGCVIGFTATNIDKVVPNMLGVDLSCLDKDTEFCTPNGWKKISEYSKGDLVLNYNKYDDSSKFVKPNFYIKEKCNLFYHLKNEKGLDQVVTSDHKMLVFKGYSKEKTLNEDITAKDLITKFNGNGYYNFKASTNIKDNVGVGLSDNLIRVDIMLSADGCLRNEYENYNFMEMHLKKERKVKRAIEILNLSNLEFKYNKSKNDDTYYFYIKVPKYINKDLKKYYNATKEELKIVCEESLKWDGYEGYRSYYCSTDKANADVIQFAFTCCNIRTGIHNTKKYNDDYKQMYQIIPTKNKYVNYIGEVSEIKSEDGFKYCFNMDTGYFLARREGKIFITGNCGMLAFNLGIEEIDLEKLDNFIRNKIPHGTSINQNIQNEFINENLINGVKYISEKTDSGYEKHLRAIGSLGAGNHFLEVNVNNITNEKYIVVHTGSRNFGHRIATYHQNKAVEYCKIKSKEFNDNRNKRIGLLKQQDRYSEIQTVFEEVNIYDVPKYLAFLEGELMEDYFRDIKIANEFAIANRETIINNICKFLNRSYSNSELLSIHTIHNYFDGTTIRKGSISAMKDEIVLIPINMRDGSIIAKGKGNAEYNNSAPHGAGRLMSRTKAKAEVNLDDFKESMKDIYTSSVNENTIDESPFAYKDINEIINNTKDTIEILHIIKPIYNFKSN